ncbi:MAG: 50S ribosomal protein L25 [Epsilonproteobacteria bacterium]|nr:MAG: 50S ribosomal protein L25 [Campylobacterota bacterium]RLA66944.1 MAG: 50S ribosomal protein L25 [Campylobacterota bacterium]
MTEYPKLEIQSRPPKNEIKPSQLRRDNRLPGVIYGKGIDSIPFQITEGTWSKFYRRRPNIFNISIDGKKDILVTLREMAKKPGTDHIEHLSFQKLTKGQETTVSIPIKITGEAKGPLTLVLKTIEIKGIPKNMPKNIEINVEDLEPGSYFSVADVPVTKGLTIMAESDQIIISCQRRQVIEEEPANVEEAAPEDQKPPEATPA